MVSGKAIERYYWFHGQVKNGKYPNAKRLAERFEISDRQAARDIEFFKTRLFAPLKYIRKKRGYEYEDKGYEIPPTWFNEEELHAFCLALRLSSTIPDKELKKTLCYFLQRIVDCRTLSSNLNLQTIEERISVKNVEYYKVNEKVFREVLDALFRNKPLEILYYSPHKKEESIRSIVPLHLLCYMGSWHLIAYCVVKKGLRDFALSRIKELKYLDKQINLPNNLPSIKEYIRMNFGIMTGKESIEVCIKFNPDVSQWVSEMIWHASQDSYLNPDGSMILKFPVADFREIIHEILKFGSNAEVMSPPELRNMIKEEIQKMQKIY